MVQAAKRTVLGALHAYLDPTPWLSALYLSGCDRVGTGTRALGRPLVFNEGRIEIGRNATLRSSGAPVRLVATRGGSILIGNGVTIDGGAHIFSERSVRIEDNVHIGPNAIVTDRDEKGSSGELVIERNVRLGVGARLVGACRIGPEATVQAGSTVRGDVPGGAVIGRRTRESGANGGGETARVKGHLNGAGRTTAAEPPPPARLRQLRAVLTSDFTLNELADRLGAVVEDGLVIESEVAPFDQVVPTLLGLRSRDPKVDLAVVWTRPECVCPSFRDVLLGIDVDRDRVLAEVDSFSSLLREHSDGARFLLVPSWTVPAWRRGMGMLELRGERAGSLLMRMNLRLAEAVRELPNVFLLDAQRWAATASDGGFDPKLWHAGKVAFTTEVLAEAAQDVHAAVRGLLGLSRKLVVVDLDDTLWGGIVGDVGWEALQLGGHDPEGEAFVEFQKRLLALTKRGIALAVVSKNEESTALEAMRSHPEMVIRPEMLAALRINWSDKAQNIADIAQELNLGLQSVVFIDDNPIERGRVREALPEVHVPEWPLDPTHYPRALESLRCFDTPHVSAEDLERNSMYATERERTALRGKVSSIDEWLATLELVVRFERLGSANIARAAQLLNKTNQMNLRTRRLSEPELMAWSHEAGHEMWTIHVADRFGNAGLTGLLGLAREAEVVQMSDFVLSCRVMGRRVEEAMVWAGRKRGAALGGRSLVVTPIPTKKNKPCLDFFARAQGLTSMDDGYRAPLDGGEPAPSLVRIEGLS